MHVHLCLHGDQHVLAGIVASLMCVFGVLTPSLACQQDPAAAQQSIVISQLGMPIHHRAEHFCTVLTVVIHVFVAYTQAHLLQQSLQQVEAMAASLAAAEQQLQRQAADLAAAAAAVQREQTYQQQVLEDKLGSLPLNAGGVHFEVRTAPSLPCALYARLLRHAAHRQACLAGPCIRAVLQRAAGKMRCLASCLGVVRTT